MMRLSPRKQLLAQLAGIPIGILGAVPTYALFAATYPIGGEQFPAPAAMAWRGRRRDRAGGRRSPRGGQAAMAAAALFTAWVRTGERAAETRRSSTRTPARALDQAVDDKPHERGIAVIPPGVFDDRRRAYRFGRSGGTRRTTRITRT